MQRRTFVFGLGTIATLSGAASVTGASLAESTTTGTEFRVIVDERFIVASANDESEYDNGETDEDNLTEDGTLDFDSLEVEDLPTAYSEGSTDDENLLIEIAVREGDDSADFGDENDVGIIELTNSGDTTEGVGIRHEDPDGEDDGYGADVETDDQEAAVDDAFDYIVDDDGTELGIGPDPDEELSEGSIELAPEESAEVRITVDVDNGNLPIESDANPFESTNNNVELLDTVWIGVEAE